MTQIFAHISVSLDGYINDSEGNDGFFPIDLSFHEHIETMLSSIGGMVFGRKAYDLLATFWPQADGYGDENLTRQASYMNTLPKFVLTHRALDTNWANSSAVSVDKLARIKQGADRPIAVFAGAGAIEAVLRAGLLDRLELLRQPVALGGGLQLFPRCSGPVPFNLLETRVLGTGAVLEAYRSADGAAGAVNSATPGIR